MSTGRKYFGTDGIRGPYGGPVNNEAFFSRLGRATGAWAKASGGGRRETGSPVAPDKAVTGRRVLMGRDTRESGLPLGAAVAAGLRLAGLEPIDLGVLPTPAVARAVLLEGAPLGVVITASHNPAGDNGIKLFKRGGLKLSDEEEARIVEALFVDEPGGEKALAHAWEEQKKREAVSSDSDETARTGYIEAMMRLLPGSALRGWHLVLDTAWGATLFTSPEVFRRLGAAVDLIGGASKSAIDLAHLFSPHEWVRTGSRLQAAKINDGCGSEHPELMAARVRATGARLGVAHDGDGDRCVLCDEHGEVLDGDEILTLLALHALRQGRLAADTLVVTVQSNLGVDAAVTAAGGRVVRTPVGDRHVAETMRAEGATLGGESSGHIICADISPTGDGLVAALRVIGVMLATGQPLSELRRGLKKYPQAAGTVVAAAKPPVETLPALMKAIHALEAELGQQGRVLVRWSGTEPKLRLLVEGPTEAVVRAGLQKLKMAARADLAGTGAE